MNAEKYTRRIRETSVNVVQTRIDSVRRSDIVKTGMRVFDGKHIGVAGAIGSVNGKELEKKAVKALRRGITYPWQPAGSRMEKIRIPFDLPDENEFIIEMEAILEVLRSRYPELIFSNRGSLIESTTGIQNDLGLDLEYITRHLSVLLCFKHRNSISVMDCFTGFGGAFMYDRQTAIEDICEVCEAFEKPAALPGTGKMPVIFSVNDRLFLKKIILDLNGHQYGSGSSLLSGRMGERIFDESFSVIQTPDHLIQSEPFFDAEGTVNDDYIYPLIEEGVLKAVCTDKRTADRFDLPLTGAAGSEYDSVPSLGFPDMRIKDTGKTLKEILKGEQGVFAMMAGGGDFTPQGDFGTPVQVALLHDGEKFTGRLPEFRLSSSVFRMFGEDYIGSSTDSISRLTESRCIVSAMDVEKIE